MIQNGTVPGRFSFHFVEIYKKLITKCMKTFQILIKFGMFTMCDFENTANFSGCPKIMVKEIFFNSKVPSRT